MPGFLSNYDGVTRLELDHGYWIDYKKTLSADDMGAAEKALVGANFQTENEEAKVAFTTDVAGYLREQVVAAVVDWNLDGAPFGPDGEIWPLTPIRARRASIGALPAGVYDELSKAVRAANSKRSKEEARSFLADGERGDSAREVEPSDGSEVLPGAGVPSEDGSLPGSTAAASETVA